MEKFIKIIIIFFITNLLIIKLFKNTVKIGILGWLKATMSPFIYWI